MKIKFQVIIFLFCTGAYAQFGVGTTQPNPSAQLEVVASDKGILIPKISLTSDIDNTTIVNGNVESLLVYNTNTENGLFAGYYYWSQGKWQQLATTDNLTISKENVISSDGSITGVANAAVLVPMNLKVNIDNVTIEVNALNGIQLKDGGITSLKIGDNAITANKLNQMGASSGQVLKWNGTSWAVAIDENTMRTITDDLNSTSITEALSANKGKELNDTKLNKTLTDANILIGDGSNTATAQTISGDATLANDGVLSISNGAVTTAKLANDAVDTAKILNGTITNLDLTASLQSDLSNSEQTTNKNVAGGYPGLDVNSKIDASYLPSLTTNNVYTAGSQTAQDGLAPVTGDVVIRTDTSINYIFDGSGWLELSPGATSVTTVNGKTGVVVLNKTDLTLGNVDNTSDADKPISNAVGFELAEKALKTNVLELDNTTAFTPSNNYEPATKKYVDDNSTTIINDLTTGGTTEALSAEQGKELNDTKLNKTLTDANILIGDGTNTATAQTISGDATLANDGVLSISNGAVTTAKLANDAVDTAKILNGTITNLDLTASLQSDLSNSEQTTNKNVAGGYPGLDVNSKIDASYLPSLTTNNVYTAGSQTAQDGLAPVTGDVVIRTDTSINYIYDGSGWLELSPGATSVTTVNGKTGVVVLNKTDLTLGNVDNTSDADKPISIAVGFELAEKALKTNVLELDNTTAFTPTADNQPATKKYVDDNASITVIEDVLTSTDATTALSANQGRELENSKAAKTNVLELDNTVAFDPTADYEPATKKYVDDNGTTVEDVLNSISTVNALSANQGKVLEDSKAAKNNVLELDNTVAFDPTADYEPATKKYVDDNSTTIINDLTTGGTTEALSAEQGKELNDTKLNKTLTDANILIGDGTNTATAQTISGDATLANDGVLSISNGAVTTAKLANDAVDTAKILNGTITNLDLTASLQSDLSNSEQTTNKNVAGGYPGLDVNSKIDASYLPSLTTNNVYTAGSQTAQDGLAPVTGDVVIRTDTSINYIYDGSGWLELSPGVVSVTTVNGKTGVVVLNKTDLTLGNVDNTSDADKPISNAVGLGLAEKALKTNVLELDNTTAFTPSNNYEPATKKYVDDNSTTIVNDLTTGGTTEALSAEQGKELNDTKLNKTLTVANILIGDGTNTATAQTISGDATLANDGVLSISNGAVTTAKLANDAVDTAKILNGTITNLDLTASLQSDLSNSEQTTNKNVAGGYPGLDVNSKIDASYLPSLTTNNVYTAGSQTAQDGLAPVTGDVVIRTDTSINYIYDGSGWLELSPGATSVTTVNGKTGVVVLNKTDLNLGNVENTSDADKPISNAVGLELAEKALKTNVLELDNTTAFTPTADNQPATKKYVDDNASITVIEDVLTSTDATTALSANQGRELENSKAAKNNVLELDNTVAFDPTADYEPATKKYVDDNSTTIVDDLTTGGTTEALSAEQGKELNDTKLNKTLTDANILIGDGTNTATAQTISGDATLANDGVLSISNGAVTTAKLANDAVDTAKILNGTITNLDLTASLQSDLSNSEQTTNKNVAGGYPGLDVNSKIDASYLPSLTTNNVYTAGSQTAQDGLAPVTGDVVIRTDTSINYIYDGSGWLELSPGVVSVTTVNGKTGVVVLNKTDLTLGNVDNTSDADKPISNAVGLELAEKALKTNVLELDNTVAFDPTTDYEPATKKYVDDNSTTIINDLTTGGTTEALSAEQGKELNDTKLNKTLTDANILIGDGTNTATAQTISGDATLANDGVLSISNGAVTTAKLANDAVDTAKILNGTITNLDLTASLQSDLSNSEQTTNKNVAGGYPGLDVNSKIDASYLPSLTTNNVYTAGSQTAQDGLAPVTGDVVIRTDTSINYIYDGSGWLELSPGATSVTTVNGKTGVVVLNKTDLTLGNVDNTSDADKPISIAVGFELAEKALKTNVLELDNTTAFTPTADNQPATKKYVDDNASITVIEDVLTSTDATTALSANQGRELENSKAAKTNVLELDNTVAFDPTSDYEPATKKYVDDNSTTIVDDLTTGGTTEALSAEQGKELNDTKLNKTLTDANILIGDGTNTATAQTISGDATLANDGVLFISNGAVTTAKLGDNAVDGTKISLSSETTGDVMYYNGTDWIRLAKGTAGQLLQMNTGATAPEWKTGTSTTIVDDLTTGGTTEALSAEQGKELNDTKLNKTLTDANILIGDGTNTATAQTISGDATLANDGVLSISNGAVTTAKLANDAVDTAKILNGTITNLDLTASLQSDLSNSEQTTNKNVAGGYPGLDVNSKIDASYLPSLTTNNVYTAGSQTAQDGLTPVTGDVVIRTDTSINYIYDGSGWLELSPGVVSVTTVNGKTGVVVLNKTDLTLGNVDNTSDADKPISNAVGLELAEKALKTNVLELDNTVAFDPTTDYEPATKKYVDDNSTTIVNDLTTGGTTEALSAEQGKELNDTKLNKTLTVANILIGDGTNTATAQTISGDATLANDGVLSISNGAVTTAKLANDAVDTAKILNGTITNLDLTASLQSDLSNSEQTTNKNVAGGYPGLDVNSKIDASYLPSLTTNNVYTAGSQTAQDGLAPVTGDVVIRTDTSINYIYDGSGWLELSPGATSVTTVNGKTGVVVLNKTDLTLGNVDNTSDADKPISNAVGLELAEKALKTNVLELDNTTAFTPTADNQPATKKYVDDNASITVIEDVLTSTDAGTALSANQGRELENSKAAKANVLELDNTVAFDPTSDYEPATKKYVDDNGTTIEDVLNSISTVNALSANQGKVLEDSKAAKNNVLELDNTVAFDPTADYEPATKKYVDDNSTTIVNDLTTGGTTEALSAEQGKELNDTKLNKTLTDANILIGDGTNTATAQTISGDATLANDGVLSISNGAVTTAKLGDDAVDGTKISLSSEATGDVMYYNGTDWIRLAKGTAGQLLQMNTRCNSSRMENWRNYNHS